MSSPAARQVPAELSGEVLTLKSAHLFQEARTVCIEHAGQRYQLRLTKENKLILTK